MDAIASSPSQPQKAAIFPRPAPVFDDILVPFHKPIKKPLPVWAVTVRSQFDDLVVSARQNLSGAISAVMACYNEAALMEVHYGRLEAAAALCHASLEWLDRCRPHVDTPVALRFVFQPYINLGRLDRIQGRYEDALYKLNAVYRASQGESVQVCRFQLTSSMSEAVFSSPDSPGHLVRTVYVLDSLKTFLKAKLREDALSFIATAQPLATDVTIRDILAEGSIAALCELGRYNKAMEATDRILGDAECPNRMLFLFRRAEVFASAGLIDNALRVAVKLAVAFLAHAGPLSFARVELLARLAALLAWLEAPQARDISELGYRTSTRLDDVLLRAHFMNLSATLDGSDALREQAREIKKDGWYGRAKDPSPMNVLDDLSSALCNYARHDPLEPGDRP